MAGNGNLYASRGTKEDEYYTDLVTIENELKYYREHFKDKVIFVTAMILMKAIFLNILP